MNHPLSRDDVRPLIELLRQGNHADLDRTRLIFCNRDIDMHQIEAIGFDMDYTLALYHQEAMDRLSVELTVDRLISERGYPEDIREIKPKHDFAIRGLVLDTHLGNILKLDSHRHVGKAYHGLRELAPEQLNLYRQEVIRFNDDRFALVDTLYALPEAFLYAVMVDFMERAYPAPGVNYRELYEDIRFCIDLAHRDGSFQAGILAEPERFVTRNEALAITLHRLRSAGKKLFLLTNSYPDYSERLMCHLLDGVLPEYPSWRNYFDIIIAGAQKPAFFSQHSPFLRVDDALQPGGEEHERFERDRIYQGGNLREFMAITGYAPEQVMYVGDHIYGDILRSKKTTAWRTVMIVQEMEREQHKFLELQEDYRKLHHIEEQLARLTQTLSYDQWLDHNLETLLPHHGEEPVDPAQRAHTLQLARQELRQSRDRVKRRRKELLEQLLATERHLEALFNPYWGLIFKQHNKNSVFGEQVEDYACLYTSRVANFAHYSPHHYFRAPRQPMPHEIG